jgi:hypothetical protein
MVIDPSKAVDLKARVEETSTRPRGRVRDTSVSSERSEARRDQVQISDEARALAAGGSETLSVGESSKVAEVQKRLSEAFYDDPQIAQETVQRILSAGIL